MASYVYGTPGRDLTSTVVVGTPGCLVLHHELEHHELEHHELEHRELEHHEWDRVVH